MWKLKFKSLKSSECITIGVSSVMEFFQQYVWPKINIFNPRKSYFVNTMNDSSSKIGHEFRKYSVSEIEVIKYFF